MIMLPKRRASLEKSALSAAARWRQQATRRIVGRQRKRPAAEREERRYIDSRQASQRRNQNGDNQASK